jgi:hypothetical protein
MQQSRNDKRLWRRTRLTRADGSPIPDDWTLEDDSGQPLGRIYAETGGPQNGGWFWAVLVALDGTPFNGGTGHTETGREAREAVEARVPKGLSMKRPSHSSRTSSARPVKPGFFLGLNQAVRLSYQSRVARTI